MSGDLDRVRSVIAKVQWAGLEPAYGPATHVPELILALTSTDERVRNAAWSDLHGNLWHQGTVYEATSHAVPVFLELLLTPDAPAKHDVLAFLALLFNGQSYWDVHQHLRTSKAEVTNPEFQQTLQTELSWVAATKEAVAAGKDIYLQLLQFADPGSRIAAAYLLGVIGATDLETLEQVINAAGG